MMPCPRALWWGLWLSPKGAALFRCINKQGGALCAWGGVQLWLRLSLVISAGFVTQLQPDLLALIWIC